MEFIGKADLFQNAQASAPWTYPSMAAIMSGQHPGALGVTLGEKLIPSNTPLLAEFLASAGYRTSGVVSAHLMKKETGLARGFDSYDDEQADEGRFFKAPAVFERGWEMIQAHHREPFFQYIHLWDPHYPYYLHPEFDFMPNYQGIRTSGEWPEAYNKDPASISSKDREYIRSLYDSEIAFTDQALGAFLARLEKADLLEQSLVIITSDHGEEFGERGWYGHQWSLHQEMLHVPLVLKWPGQKQGNRCGYASHVDLLPTMLQAAGLEKDFMSDGVPLQEGNSWLVRPLFSETVRNEASNQFRDRSVDQVSLRFGPHKVIQDNIAAGHGGNKLAFFNLEQDPGELSARHFPGNDLEKELAHTLELNRSTISRRFQQLPVDEQPGLIPQELRTRLRSLGYL